MKKLLGILVLSLLFFSNVNAEERESELKNLFKQLKNSQISGGESGIRTHGTFDSTQAFQACALNHSAISPFKTPYLFLKLQ